MSDAGYFHVRESNDFHDSLIRQRRYALLQAAATLTVHQDFSTPMKAVKGAKWFEFAVAQANILLAEIERQENKQ